MAETQVLSASNPSPYGPLKKANAPDHRDSIILQHASRTDILDVSLCGGRVGYRNTLGIRAGEGGGQ